MESNVCVLEPVHCAIPGDSEVNFWTVNVASSWQRMPYQTNCDPCDIPSSHDVLLSHPLQNPGYTHALNSLFVQSNGMAASLVQTVKQLIAPQLVLRRRT